METKLLKAIMYRNLDEARRVLAEVTAGSMDDIFNDAGEEPQGLLAVIPEDRLPEEIFYRLFDARKGTLVEVERIPYSGYGPPALEEDYMGFVSEGVAYVLKGCRLPVEIRHCPFGAVDLHHLEALVLDEVHPLDRAHLARALELPEDWDFEDLFELISEGVITAQEIDQMIHRHVH